MLIGTTQMLHNRIANLDCTDGFFARSGKVWGSNTYFERYNNRTLDSVRFVD